MIPVLIGFLLMRASSSGLQGVCRHDGFRLILGTSLGIGLCSASYFLGLVTAIDGFLLETLLLLVAGVVVAMRPNNGRCQFCEAPAKIGNDRRLTLALGAVFCAAAGG